MGTHMSRNKPAGKKLRIASVSKVRSAPRWADIKKFGLKRARTRRIRVHVRTKRSGPMRV
jgi:ribosomal protein L39E